MSITYLKAYDLFARKQQLAAYRHSILIVTSYVLNALLVVLIFAHAVASGDSPLLVGALHE